MTYEKSVKDNTISNNIIQVEIIGETIINRRNLINVYYNNKPYCF